MSMNFAPTLLRALAVSSCVVAASVAAELHIGASYRGSYRPDGNAEPYSESDWRRRPGTLSVEPNTDNGVRSPGLAAFNDSSANASYAIYFPCAKAFGTDPAQVGYEFMFRAKFHPEGASMPPPLIDRAVAGIGFHDEPGEVSRGKVVTLGFFLSDKLQTGLGQRAVGLIGDDGRLQHLVSAMDWLDGKIHEYRVRKYFEAGVPRLMVWIDGTVVNDSAVYADLPNATGDELGFWYGTSTPGTINATVEAFAFGQPMQKYSVGPSDDFRDIRNGFTIYNKGYADQPYVVVNLDKTLTCVVTVAGGVEGTSGQHVVVTRSTDGGMTWNEPVPLEPLGSPENSWGLPILAHSGRIYVLYTFNEGNLRSVLDNEGKPFYRVDAVGKFVFRYSDDRGLTWSANRFTIPIRTTDYDLTNIYRGDVNGDGVADDKDARFFWSASAAYTDGRTVYVGIAKIRDVNQSNSGSSEGWVFISPNILTESDPERIIWEMRPEGTYGLRSRGGRICEETTVIKTASERLAAICRTTEGYMPVFYSDNEGKSWGSPIPLAYAANGKPLKNPRAKPCLWPLGMGKYLVWFENNGSKGFDNRNPAWVAVAEEINGQLVCSQPEIFLYDRNPTIRISYPDFFQHNGRYFVTETQKTVARLHEIPASFIEQLSRQGIDNSVAHEGLSREWSSKNSRNLRLPAPPDVNVKGLTLEFWVKITDSGMESILFDSTTEGSQGIRVSMLKDRVYFSISDGVTAARLRSDAVKLAIGQWNHIVCIVEPGPRLLMCAINGILSDGGLDSEFGWVRYPSELTNVGGTPAVFVGRRIGGTLGLMRYYERPLTVSEVISNYRAGFSSQNSSPRN